MKFCYSIVAMMVGGAILCGCGTPVKHPSRAANSPTTKPAAAADPDNADAVATQDLWPNDFVDEEPHPPARGNPEALAHFAAGISYEWNDQDSKAVEQFYESALEDPTDEHLAIKVAERYLKTKEAGKAVKVLANCARRPDASGLLYSWLARACAAEGKTNQALAASRVAISRAPAELDCYESEIEIYLNSHDPARAVRVMDRAAKAISPEVDSLLDLAGYYITYLKTHDKDTLTKAHAIGLLDRISLINFASPRLWQSLADDYTALDRPKKAAAIYNQLIADTPEHSPARTAFHEKLAGIYFQAEDRTNAMKQLQAIVRDNPTRYPRAWFFLGELAYEDNRLDDALDDYQNALHWDPSYDETYYKLALTLIGLHRDDEAFKILDDARLRFAKTFKCEFYTGVAYLQVKDFKQAIRHFDTAEVIGLATTPSVADYWFYFQFGEACERDQDYKRAAENLQKCIDLNPNFGEGLNYLGYMLADRGEQLPRAKSLIEKAVRLEPGNGAYVDSLGWVLFKQKQPQQALPYLLKAVALSPEPDATILDHLGEVYMALHQSAKAIEAWKKSLSIESSPEVKKKLDFYSGGV